jgi:hypothetical protein
MPPRAVRRTEAQVSSLVFRRLGDPRLGSMQPHSRSSHRSCGHSSRPPTSGCGPSGRYARKRPVPGPNRRTPANSVLARKGPRTRHGTLLRMSGVLLCSSGKSADQLDGLIGQSRTSWPTALVDPALLVRTLQGGQARSGQVGDDVGPERCVRSRERHPGTASKPPSRPLFPRVRSGATGTPRRAFSWRTSTQGRPVRAPRGRPARLSPE